MERRTKKFHSMMSMEDFEKLTWLGEHCGLSRGTIVRQMIWLRYKVTHDQQNACADGHQCLCRDMRQFPASYKGGVQKEIEENEGREVAQNEDEDGQRNMEEILSERDKKVQEPC